MSDRTDSAPNARADRGRRRWYFATAVLDEPTLELRVDGADAGLERKPLELLLYLLERAGEVCTKDELLEGVWPGRVLSETVLTKCIGRVRDALGDRNQDVIKTAYGFGYRLIAPVRIEVSAGPQVLPLRLEPGDHPANRPLWSLIERLDRAGPGEVWLGRHEKTREERVFKFALDEATLGALKREITMFRVLHDALGGHGPIIRVLDWNLEQAPYFIESEYLADGNLEDWAKSRGGLAAIAPAQRIEMVAKLACAVARLHSVGMLHKDLRPPNIFVKAMAGGDVDIVLGGFSRATVLDAAHVERLGITRWGWTKTSIPRGYPSVASPYLAPETVDGAPFTTRSDNYAIGVILYQALVGNFHRAFTASWREEVDDELLREDLGLVTDGNPASRLSDAEVLANRLRSLAERRHDLEMRRRREQSNAARSVAAPERLATRYRVMAVLLGVLLLALAVVGGSYVDARRARQRSLIAASLAEQSARFIAEEAAIPQDGASDRLRRIGGDIDARFDSQPRVAAELHYLLGLAYGRLGDNQSSSAHLNRAIDLVEPLDGALDRHLLLSAAELIPLDDAGGNLRTTLPRYQKILATAQARGDADEVALHELERRVADGRARLESSR